MCVLVSYYSLSRRWFVCKLLRSVGRPVLRVRTSAFLEVPSKQKWLHHHRLPTNDRRGLINLLECTRHQAPVAPGCQLSPFSHLPTTRRPSLIASHPGIQIMHADLPAELTVDKVLPAPTSMSVRYLSHTAPLIALLRYYGLGGYAAGERHAAIFE